MANPWFEHLKKVKEANPGITLGDAMKLAKKSYIPINGPVKKKAPKKKAPKKKSKNSKKSKKSKK